MQARHPFQILFAFSIFILLGSSLTGCSIGLIDRAPEPVLWNNVSLGQSRNEVKKLLAQKPQDAKPPLPVSFVKTDEEGKDNFQFIDGWDVHLKSRKYLYLIADIFSIGLGELIFIPLEQNVPHGNKCTAIAAFDEGNRLTYFKVTKDTGEVLKEVGNLPTARPALAQVLPSNPAAPATGSEVTAIANEKSPSVYEVSDAVSSQPVHPKYHHYRIYKPLPAPHPVKVTVNPRASKPHKVPQAAPASMGGGADPSN